jgi:hypothetical protein
MASIRAETEGAYEIETVIQAGGNRLRTVIHNFPAAENPPEMN